MNSSSRKAEKLGMSFGAARSKLVKNLLWDFVVKAGQNICHQCNTEILTIHDLSIEHKTPWENSENPVENYFDLDNIAYSHLSCNCRAAERQTSPCPSLAAYKRGCRCEDCVKIESDKKKRVYTTEKRRSRYERTGN